MVYEELSFWELDTFDEWDQLLEDDGISAQEEGFMRGWVSAGTWSDD